MKNTLITHLKDYWKLWIAFVFLVLTGFLFHAGVYNVLNEVFNAIYFGGSAVSITATAIFFGLFMSEVDMKFEKGLC